MQTRSLCIPTQGGRSNTSEGESNVGREETRAGGDYWKCGRRSKRNEPPRHGGRQEVLLDVGCSVLDVRCSRLHQMRTFDIEHPTLNLGAKKEGRTWGSTLC